MSFKWRIAQTLELHWWRWYLARRRPEDYLDQKRRYWQRVLRVSGARTNPGDRVLDAGCGPAGIFLILEECEVTALDPLLEAYEARLPHFSRSWYPEVRFKALPLEQLDEKGAFDTVYCLNAINHVSDLSPALDRLLDALRPGGKLLMTVDVHRCHWLKKFFRWVPADVLHPHQHALADYVAMIETRQCRIRHTKLLKPGWIFDYYLLLAEKDK